MTDPLEKLSAALRDRRDALGLTQEEVGLEAGMSQSAVSRIERGQSDVRFRTLVRLTEALETTLGELLGVS